MPDPTTLHTEEARLHFEALVTKNELLVPAPRTTARLLDKLVGEYIEMSNRPRFVCDHPEIMSPLAKYHRTRPGLTERFELFINGKELCNSYTELNNPRVQVRLRFYTVCVILTDIHR